MKGSVSPLDVPSEEIQRRFVIYQYMSVFHLSYEEAIQTPFSIIRQMLEFQGIVNELNNQSMS